MNKDHAPWGNPQVADWLAGNQGWDAFILMIRRTLAHDPRKYPQQIRTAAAMVVLLCREGLWPARGGNDEREEIVALARRQIAQIKQLYSIEARQNAELTGSSEYRLLMKTLDEEMRALDARRSPSPLNIPNQPPSAWGDFF